MLARRAALIWIAGVVSVLCLGIPHFAAAQERAITLAAPDDLVESGVLKFILPRFSLKNSIRVTVVPPGSPSAQAALSAEAGSDGLAVFAGPAGTYRLSVAEQSDFVTRLADWLTSDAGQNAIAGFVVDGAAPFGPPQETIVEAVALDVDGNADVGETLALAHCGRCHVVSEKNRMNGIGSTPSFAVMRTFDDWEGRFAAFYVLKPHPAFTQVADVTQPFSPERPSPIAPIEMSLDDVENILAYVAGMAPADLGRPIEHQ